MKLNIINAVGILGIALLSSGCSLTELHPIYSPDNRSNWTFFQNKVPSVYYFNKNFTKGIADTLNFSIGCSNNNLRDLSFGPPYVPFIPNIIVLFHLKRSNVFDINVILAGRKNDSLEINLNDIDFNFNNEFLLKPISIKKGELNPKYAKMLLFYTSYSSNDMVGNSYQLTFLLPEDKKNIKSLCINFSKNAILHNLDKINFTRYKKLIYIPIFAN